jgi:hypothetical protein
MDPTRHVTAPEDHVPFLKRAAYGTRAPAVYRDEQSHEVVRIAGPPLRLGDGRAVCD